MRNAAALSELRETRIRLGLSQRQVAERLEVTQATVARWESGKNKPHPLFVRALLKILEDVSREAA